MDGISSMEALTEENMIEFHKDEELQKLLIKWNQTDSHYSREKTIQQWFEEQVKARGSEIALIFGNETLSYEVLNQRANWVAHYLRAEGVKPGQIIPVCLKPSFDLLACILGILKAGCAYLPLDASYPLERLQFMLTDTEAECLLTNSENRALFSDLAIRLIDVELHCGNFPKKDANPDVVNSADDLAYIIYTSGSTGRPKGAMLTHHNVGFFLHWFQEATKITADDIFDFSSSISFDFTVASTLFPLTQGAKIAICPEGVRKDPYLYIQHLITSHSSLVKLTPSHFRQLKECISPDQQLPDLRCLIFGGEPLYASDIKDWLTQFPHQMVVHEYGPTETTVATTSLIIDIHNIDQLPNKLPIGKPVFNSQLYILNNQQQLAAINEEGELFIGGEGVGKGYWRRPDITNERFIRDPFSVDPRARLYKTGDLCRYLPDGNIEFIGRADHQIKIRGFRVEIDEVERCIATHPLIREVVLVADSLDDDVTSEKRLVAYYTLKNIANKPTQGELVRHVQNKLPEYMVPAFFVFLPSFPLSPNGKLDRKALPKPVLHADDESLAPRSQLEQTMLVIWSQVLNLNNISVDDNFFDLGGHSLAAARIISKIAKETQRRIKLHDFYNAPTISQLAVLIESENETHIHHEMTHMLRDNEALPLSNMQFLFWVANKFRTKNRTLNLVDKIRVKGKLNASWLQQAFEVLIKRHEMLRFLIGDYTPIQQLQMNVEFKLQEHDLGTLPLARQEQELALSLLQLKQDAQWLKHAPLIKARLFHLGKEQSELQICLSHYAGDEISQKIIFNELSKCYEALKQNQKIPRNLITRDAGYQEYILREREHLKRYLPRDIDFWSSYLDGVKLCTLPKNEVISNPDETFCTSYLEIDETLLISLQRFCAKNRISLADALYAAVGIAMQPYLKPKNNESMVIYCLKSARDNDAYDQSLGFFVKTDILKMDFHDEPGLLELAKQVHKSTILTSPYQFCPSIIQFANLYKENWQNKRWFNMTINIISYLLSKLFYRSKPNYFILQMYGRMLGAFTKNQCDFLVQVNVLNNFLNAKGAETNKSLFGYQAKIQAETKDDKLASKQILDFCFTRNSDNKYYLIISGNIIASSRERMGQAVLDGLNGVLKAKDV